MTDTGALDGLEGNVALRARIAAVFAELWAEQNDGPPPALSDETVLLQSGMDSLGFAIFVARLDEELGFDPFTAAEEAFYPQTFGEFVTFYARHAGGGEPHGSEGGA